MNAKDYLENAKSELNHFDLVCRSVFALYVVRDDRRKTEEYCNRYLFADARLRGSAHEALLENEVEPLLAPAVRLEILNVIAGDDSFEFARNIILKGDHCYRMPGDYLRILHDPHAASSCKEDDQQMIFYNLCLEILNDINVKDKIKQLMGIIMTQGVNGIHTQRPTKEMEQLKAALVESERMMALRDGELAQKETELAALRKELNDDEEGEVFTVAQLCLLSVYLFAVLGVHPDNSLKTEWARFLHQISGKSVNKIRNTLSFNYDSKFTKKNLRHIASCISNLFLGIANNMLNDIKNDPSAAAATGNATG